MKKLIVPIIVGLVMFAAAFGGAFYFQNYRSTETERAIASVTRASLEALQEEKRLTVMTARYAAVVTPSSEPILAEAKQETKESDKGEKNEGDPKPAEGADPASGASNSSHILIMPGTVRYEIDLKAIKPEHVVWHEAEKTLAVKLPPLALAGPNIDLNDIRERIGNGQQRMLSNAKQVLNKRNRITAEVDLTEQARAEASMRMARDMGRKMIERAFRIPLKSAGVTAAMAVYFEDEVIEESGGEKAPAADKEG